MIDLDTMEAIARAATKVAPGEWYSGYERGEGSYGSGPNVSEGYDEFSVYASEAPSCLGRDRAIAHMSCESAEVHEEFDEDGGRAWDAAGEAVAAHIATFDPQTVLALIAEHRALAARVKEMKAALKPLAEVGRSYTVQTMPLGGIFTLLNKQVDRMTGLNADHLREAARVCKEASDGNHS